MQHRKYTRGEKERFLIGQDNTTCANFRESPLFRSYVQHKNKPAINLLIFSQLDAWMLAEGIIFKGMRCAEKGKRTLKKCF